MDLDIQDRFRTSKEVSELDETTMICMNNHIVDRNEVLGADTGSVTFSNFWYFSDVGIGRQDRLKICWSVMTVRVRPPLGVQIDSNPE